MLAQNRVRFQKKGDQRNALHDEERFLLLKIFQMRMGSDVLITPGQGVLESMQ
jgi:hypothetical protein